MNKMNPILSHALLALLYTAVLIAVLSLCGVGHPEVWAAVVVAVNFIGREAGQRDHDLAHQGWGDTSAYFAAQFAYGWSRDNAYQSGVPAAVAAVVAIIYRLAV